jgi:serine/threonine-protein kinase
MGVVYLARHTLLDEQVAVKLLRDGSPSPDVLARFLREARAAAQIKSQHVARVLDVDRLATGEPFIVMEYLEGFDLAECVAAGRLPSETRLAEWILQACEALSEAHGRGIIHRDLKPSNVYVTRWRGGRELVKVLDFGISKLAEAPDSLTGTRDLLGTPLYMAPEQMLSAKLVDARADVWALGCILYQLTAGVPPFDGDSLPVVCLAIANRPHTPLPELVPGVSPELARLVDRCLAKNKERRFGSIAELARALAPIARSSTSSSELEEAPVAPAGVPLTRVDRRVLVAAVGGAAAVVAALATFAVDRAPPRDPGEEPVVAPPGTSAGAARDVPLPSGASARPPVDEAPPAAAASAPSSAPAPPRGARPPRPPRPKGPRDDRFD